MHEGVTAHYHCGHFRVLATDAPTIRHEMEAIANRRPCPACRHKEETQATTIEIMQFDPTRFAWLRQMAKEGEHGFTNTARRILHNAILDWQRDHYPDSDPLETPKQYFERTESKATKEADIE